jgi:hypothetical protein
MNEKTKHMAVPPFQILVLIWAAAVFVINAVTVVISVPGLDHWIIRGVESVMHILGQSMPVPYFKVHYFSKDSMGAAIKPRRVKAWKQKIE